MKYSEWFVPREAAEIPSQLREAGYTPLVSALLARRGIRSGQEAADFLRGGSECMPDPMLLPDMDRAAARIAEAVARGETVAVYGDYDVDGITSVCLVTSWLRAQGVAVLPYIPDRIEEGYGLNTGAIESVAARGASLIITVDCGITARAEADFARSLGLDMVVTDHHECGSAPLPRAAAVVDPKRADCDYPGGALAGVGVAFKLLCAVSGDAEGILSKYADLIATGTVADVMPLVGENRYIVRRGLDMLGSAPRPGLAALLRESGAGEKRVSASTIGFTLAPRINAAGRLGRADVAVDLLLTEDPAEAAALAAELCALNRERQEIEGRIFQQAHAMLEREPPSAPIVLACEDWHQGVIGIAASKLAEEYSLPTVMICLDGELGKGSCRSCGEFNLFDALSACADTLEGFGGHTLAAGLTIRRDRVDAFRAALAEYYGALPAMGAPALRCELRIDDPELLSMECVESLEELEPFGVGNPKPVMAITDALLERVTPIGGGKHLRLNVGKGGRSFEAVMFSRGERELGLRAGERVDAAFYPQINEFHGRRSVQLLMADIRPADQLPLCREILSGREIDSWDCAEQCPARSDFVEVWRWLERSGGSRGGPLAEIDLQRPRNVAPARLLLCLRVMDQAGLVSLRADGDAYHAEALPQAGKADLDGSPLLRELRERKRGL